MAYWLDADTFITAENSLYAFEVNSSLRARFDTQLTAKAIRSLERNLREIMAYTQDDLLVGLCTESRWSLC